MPYQARLRNGLRETERGRARMQVGHTDAKKAFRPKYFLLRTETRNFTDEFSCRAGFAENDMTLSDIKERRTERGLTAAAILLAAAAIALLTAVAPWVGDDIEYQYICLPGVADMSDTPVASLGDVAVSQWHHYFSINGRSVAHVLVQTFCGLLPPAAFVVCNAAVYVLLAFGLLLLCRNCGVRPGRPAAFAGTVALLMLGFSTYYTPAFQIGYVWMFTSTVYFLWFYFRPASSRLPAAALFAAGLLAGWGQEALCTGVSAALCLMAVFRRRSMNRRRWLLAAGYAAGTLLVCLSPAAWSRAAATHASFGDSLACLLRSSREFYLLGAFSAYLLLSRRGTCRSVFVRHAFYWNVWLVLLLFNLTIGIVPPARQLFGLELVSLLLLLRLFAAHRPGARTTAVALALCLAVATVEYGRRLGLQRDMRTTYDNIIADSRKATNGDTVYSRFARGNELWPGGHFAQSIERHVRVRMNKRVRILPAPEE